MNITVKKIDDINFIMSGTVENSVIEEKVAKFKKQVDKWLVRFKAYCEKV